MVTSEVLKVSITGTLPNNEVWSINPCFMLTTDPEVTWDQLNTLATSINALSPGTVTKNAWSTETRITGVKLEARRRDGTLQVQLEQTRGTAVVGTGTSAHPNQTSAVISLRSAFPGPSGRGRLYIPATGVLISAVTGRFGAGINSQLALEMKTYLSGIESAIQPVLGANDLVVWSRTGTAFHAVNRILCGDVPDTQRRRRDKAIETYYSTTYP